MLKHTQNAVGLVALLLLWECNTRPDLDPVGSGGSTSTGGSTSSGNEARTGGDAPSLGGRAASTGGRGSSQAGEGGASDLEDPGGSGLVSGSGGAEPLLPRPGLVTSGKESGYFKQGSWKQVSAPADITVNPSHIFQTMRGFGGAFSERGWVALQALKSADRALALRLLFSRNDGANFTWGRIPMGANQYARDRFTYDDIDSGTDEHLEHFSVDRDQDPAGGVMPFIQAAQKVRSDIKFWAVPWTPPAWMKDNRAYDGGKMLATESNWTAYANYFVKFIQAYEQEGISIHSVHPQNEPDWLAKYPSCAWGPAGSNDGSVYDPPFLARFVLNYLHPAIRSAQLDTEIWYGTFSDANHCDRYWKELVDANGLDAVRGVGLQWNCRITAEMRAAKSDLVIMMSEHQPGNSPWAAPAESLEAAGATTFWSERAPNNHGFALHTWSLLRDWIVNAEVNVYNAWHMVLDDEGVGLDTATRWPQNSLLAVDIDAGKLIVTPAYYVFRHISQFLDDGAVRIAAEGGEALAFRNPDGHIVTIIHNKEGEDRETTVAIGGTSYQLSVPASGWATLNVMPL